MSQNDKKQQMLPRNPLSIIALFVSLIEAIATVSLKIVADAGSPEVLWAIVAFIILYPTLIAALFFLILWKRREILYSPGDFSDPKSFENILRTFEQRVEAKQEAARLDQTNSLQEVYRVVDQLLSLNEVRDAVNVGRAFLKKREFEKSRQIFHYIRERVTPSEPSYYKVLANIAYALIGKQQFPEAVDVLLQVKAITGGKYFRVWHGLALAYAWFKQGETARYQTALQEAKNDNEYHYLDLDFFRQLYPEISQDL